jgi:hypothetical protein
MFVVLIVLPALVGAINRNWIPYAMLLRWPTLLALVFGTLCLLYRYGPSPRPLQHRSAPRRAGRSACRHRRCGISVCPVQ